jgi:hypothetical protein
VAIRLRGGGSASIPAAAPRVLLTTEDADVAADPQPMDLRTAGDHTCIRFMRPGAVLLQSSR